MGSMKATSKAKKAISKTNIKKAISKGTGVLNKLSNDPFYIQKKMYTTALRGAAKVTKNKRLKSVSNAADSFVEHNAEDPTYYAKMAYEKGKAKLQKKNPRSNAPQQMAPKMISS